MIVPVTMYKMVCSFPQCSKVAGGEEYYAWAEPDQCIEMAVDSDWRKGAGRPDTGHYFCPDHPTVWASDLEADEGSSAMWDFDAVKDFGYPFLILDDISKNQFDPIAYIVLDRNMLDEGLYRLANDLPIHQEQP